MYVRGKKLSVSGKKQEQSCQLFSVGWFYSALRCVTVIGTGNIVWIEGKMGSTKYQQVQH